MNKPKGLKASMLSSINPKKEETVKEDIQIHEPGFESEEKRTFSLPQSLIQNLERNAYWEHKTLKECLVEILEAHYKIKTFEPVPPTYKKPKRGKPKGK